MNLSLTTNELRELLPYLTPRERAELDSLLTAPIGLTDFKRRLWPGYVHTPFQALIDDALSDVARYIETGGKEGTGRLAIMAPPRHGKTETARYFFGWLLGRTGGQVRIINTSYTADLAYRTSRRVRNLIATDAYRAVFPSIRLSPTRAAVKEWELDGKPGGMLAAGVGGGITGHGGNLLFVDDPVKSRAEAESATFRERAKEWYANDLRTRLETPGAIVLEQTRWHEDDLTGWVLANGAEGWRELRLPALAEDNDPLGREPGAALWPERYPVSELTALRETMGDYDFSALYQQRPIPAGGRLFDTTKVQVLDTEPERVQAVRFYDLAVTAKRSSDYTVGVKLGLLADESLCVLDVWRGQRELPDVHEAIVQNAAIDGPATRIRLEAEKAGIVQLQFLLRDARMRPFNIDAVPPEGDKFTRAGPVAARLNAGRLTVVRGAWNRAFLDELSTFPVGAHDDQVDALSGAYAMLSAPRARVLFSL